MTVIFRLPAFDVNRTVLPYAVGRQPVLDRGQVDEWLEGGTWLTFCRDRAVELAVSVVATADQRPDGAIRRHRHERALSDAVPVAFLRKLLGQSFLRIGLEICIDGGLDRDVLLDATKRVVERVHNPVRDVVDGTSVCLRYDARWSCQRGALGRVRYEFKLRHGCEHGLCALFSAVKVAC